MVAHKNWRAPTVMEQNRIAVMMQLGCCCCMHIGIPNFLYTECHHILQGNKRMGHLYTLPVCRGHHRGLWEPMQVAALTPRLRDEPNQLVSIADGSKLFVPIYGTDHERWDAVQFVMKRDEKWPESKIVSRRIA